MIASAMPTTYLLDVRPARDVPGWVCYATRRGDPAWCLAVWHETAALAEQAVRTDLTGYGRHPCVFELPARAPVVAPRKAKKVWRGR